MGEYLILAGMVLVAAAALAAQRVIQNWRRARWMKVDATVDAAYYEVQGKNVFALVDISFGDGEIRRTIKRVPTGRIDVEDVSPGDLIAILVNPFARNRCVVDR